MMGIFRSKKREQEILAVHKLGEEIGYGNLMDIAQTLWAMEISNEKFLCGHIVSIKSHLKEEYAKQVNENIQGRAREIMHYLHPVEFPDVYGAWALAEFNRPREK